MSYSLIIRPDAEDDMAEARDWYAERQKSLGIEFLAAVDEVFDRIRISP